MTGKAIRAPSCRRCGRRAICSATCRAMESYLGHKFRVHNSPQARTGISIETAQEMATVGGRIGFKGLW